VLHADLPTEAAKSPKEPEMGWRRESALDVYTFGLFLLCHRGFLRTPTKWRALTFGPAARRLRAISIAILAFRLGRNVSISYLGLWSMVSPWALGFMHTKAMHVSIGLGAMVTFVAALVLWLVNYEPIQFGKGT
jgi:SPW repeat